MPTHLIAQKSSSNSANDGNPCRIQSIYKLNAEINTTKTYKHAHTHTHSANSPHCRDVIHTHTSSFALGTDQQTETCLWQSNTNSSQNESI